MNPHPFGARPVRRTLPALSFGPVRAARLALLLAAGGLASDASATEAPLADAVEKRDRAAVRALLAEPGKVNAPQVDGMTALHWAAHQDDLETARLLVGARADVKAANRYGITPLALACTNGNAAMIALFLDAGADPNGTLRGGETPLMTAARTGKVEAVKLLLARGAQIDAREARGQTALMWAVADGHLAVVEALLAAGADFKTPLNSGFTPLLFAVREGRGDVVRALLKAGADINEATQPGRGAPPKSPRRGLSPLLVAVENGHYELALQLLDAGADPNDQRSGLAPLHAISGVRKPDHGDDGDPEPVGSGAVTSLEFVRQLVAKGANVNLQLERGGSGRGQLSRRGATPFLLAADTADVPLMKLLLELGANPLTPNAEGATPLMAAAGLGTRAPTEEAGTEPEALEALKLTIELGGDLNTVDENGDTAMHGAAYANFPSIMRLLDSKGAKIEVWNKGNKRDWTPLLIAEGHRFGNFKPSDATLAAVRDIMLSHGITPPPPTPQVAVKGYGN